MTTPVYYPTPRPIHPTTGQGQAPTYPQGGAQHPILQAMIARRPIGVGGVADAVGTAVSILEVVGVLAVIVVGADVVLKWAGHPLHHGGR